MDELGKSFPAAEGLIDAEHGTTREHPNEVCLNCNTKLMDTFCHHCGQKDLPQRQTLGELLTNFISSFWSYEGKFFKTTKYLLFRPGFLAKEYTEGRRESYYHPARMYVFISFVFFLLFVSLTDTELVKNPRTEMTMDKEDFQEFKNDFKKSNVNIDSLLSGVAKWNSDSSEVKIPTAAIDSVRKLSKKNTTKKKGGKNNMNFSLSGTEYKSIAAYDSTQNALPEDKRDNWIERSLEKRTIELNEKYKDDLKKLGADFMLLFMENFSKVLFWLLPIFALLLKLLYVRRDFYYSEHLVFSIYYYNFFYLAGSVQMLVNRIPWLEWAGTVIGFWIFFYLLFAMKRMYNQRWGKTIFKFLAFTFLFSIFLGIGLTISAMIVLMVI
jgi:hypothetical protein